ncbi:MAG: hypothetical protein GY696_20255 [Gammaproteobacteria bacterium]|nr:hypothetical protein [Gammaproteobacteria bacterium]
MEIGENRQKRVWRWEPENRPNRQYRRVVSTLPPFHRWDGVTIIFGGDLSETMVKIVRNVSGDRTPKVGLIRSTNDLRM